MDFNNIKLPLAFGLLGFLFSTRNWILFMDKLNPLLGLVVYYAILTFVVIILEYFGLIIAGIAFDSISHTIGTMLIIFAFFIVVDWESCYVNTIARGSCDNISGVYLQAEDGAVYWLWSLLFSDLQTLRILTYVVTPIILSFIGTLLHPIHNSFGIVDKTI